MIQLLTGYAYARSCPEHTYSLRQPSAACGIDELADGFWGYWGKLTPGNDHTMGLLAFGVDNPTPYGITHQMRDIAQPKLFHNCRPV